MRARLGKSVIAQSEEVVEHDGYVYFPRAAVRMEWLERSPKTAEDLRCPHGVQFFDVRTGDAHAERAAWAYESPKPALRHLAQRIGFWEDVEVG
jgi:uncharacterized protein (DUF427 family)